MKTAASTISRSFKRSSQANLERVAYAATSLWRRRKRTWRKANGKRRTSAAEPPNWLSRDGTADSVITNGDVSWSPFSASVRGSLSAVLSPIFSTKAVPFSVVDPYVITHVIHQKFAIVSKVKRLHHCPKTKHNFEHFQELNHSMDADLTKVR